MERNRIKALNNASTPSNAKCVLYVMSRDQRATANHALLAAQSDALSRKLPLVVQFNVSHSKIRAQEHYMFMLEGLKQVADSLEKHNIGLVMTYGTAVKNIQTTIQDYKPTSVYFDFSPLKGPINIRNTIATSINIPTYVVDTHNIIPAWIASPHQEFAAHTFRPKVHKLLATYLKSPAKLQKHSVTLSDIPKPDFEGAEKAMSQIKASGIEIQFKSGESAAHQHLSKFIKTALPTYAQNRNNPTFNAVSNLSPYLHFGQLSSLQVALEVLDVCKSEPLLFREARMPQAGNKASVADGMNALFEEMIVRKELSDNFCLYAKSYTDFSSVPAWAQTTLSQHKADKRVFTYSLDEWEHAKTHDPAWNAAQLQLRKTGKIHGYMRMYWAKKMLEWSSSPEQALKDCIYLNDQYSIDGGDPNGYVGILWSIAGLHDRSWTERPVLGKIRYMNSGGLARKFNLEEYINTWIH